MPPKPKKAPTTPKKKGRKASTLTPHNTPKKAVKTIKIRKSDFHILPAVSLFDDSDNGLSVNSVENNFVDENEDFVSGK